MFQNRIRERREEMGLSQTKLACLIGMAGSTLSNLELGKWKTWPKAREDLVKALETIEEELFPNERCK